LKARRLAFLICSVALLAPLSSCVDVNAKASVDSSGAGRLALDYRVSRMVAPLGALDAKSRILPFPAAKADLDAAAKAARGVSLVSYEAAEGTDEIAVRAVISFSSLSSLASFLDPAGERALYSDSGGRRSLRLVIAPGSAETDPEVKRLVDTAFMDYGVKLEIALPSPVLSAGIGKATGAKAEFASSIASLAESAQPVVWEIVW